MRRRIATIINKPLREKVILDEARNNNQIIYGARSIQKQLGTISRATEDYDIFTPHVPKKTAGRIERNLDKKFKDKRTSNISITRRIIYYFITELFIFLGLIYEHYLVKK